METIEGRVATCTRMGCAGCIVGRGQHSAVWCVGAVWCGVVWCGVVWCGVVWCGVVWHGAGWHDVMWSAWRGGVSYCVVLRVIVWCCGGVLHGMV